MGRNSVKYQCYATICANLMSVGYGALCGWSSASFLVLQSDYSPLESGPMTIEETSWVGSILCIGGLLGNILFGWMSNVFGRKVPMLLVVIPQVLSWIFVIFAKNPIYLGISRFLGGIAGGATFILIPLYITEIAEDRIRGSLGSCLVLSCNIGLLLAFVLGNYLDYYIIPYVYLSLPLLFLVAFAFLPESPPYLLKSRKEKEAEKALRYFRNLRRISQEPPEHFKAEMEKLKNEFMEDDKNRDELPVSWRDFCNPTARKVMCIGVALMALNQFCGCFAMINYTASIFAESGSNLSPNSSAIIVGVIQLIGSYVSTFLVDKAGRKILITISAIGTGLGLITLGLYTYVKTLGFDVSPYGWVPIASFSFVIFIASWGVLTLPFLVLSEIMPPRIRSLGTSLCMSILWVFAFLMLKYLPIMTKILQMHGCMFIFATCSFAGAIFVMLFVPETKGKSLEQILILFE